MTIRRIEGGILGNTTDMDTTMTPFEAGLGNFVDMEKDSFIGRSALLDADKRTTLLGLNLRHSNSIIRKYDPSMGKPTSAISLQECHLQLLDWELVTLDFLILVNGLAER